VKDEHTFGKKMARNGCKMAILWVSFISKRSIVLELQNLFISITLALVDQSQQCKTEPHFWILQILHFNWCIGKRGFSCYSLHSFWQVFYICITSILCIWCWWQLLIEVDKCFIFKILQFVSLTTQSKNPPKNFWFQIFVVF
jgi:hypothetical protein